MRRSDWLPKATLAALVFVLASPAFGGQNPPAKARVSGDLEQDRQEVARIQRDIARDQEKLQQDMTQFGANSPQVSRDKANLRLEQAALKQAENIVAVDQTQGGQLALDQKQEKTLRDKLRADNQKFAADRKKFGAQSAEVKADRAQLRSDQKALNTLLTEMHWLRRQEAHEQATEMASSPAHPRLGDSGRGRP